jgi:hypothetical protein
LNNGRAELDGLAVFLAVAEQKGFRAAARQLGLTPSAVSQSIRNWNGGSARHYFREQPAALA